MHVSRSESHKQDKQRRSRRMKRLLVANISMLAIIGVLIAVFYLTNGGSKEGLDSLPDDREQGTTADNAPSAGGENGAGENDDTDGTDDAAGTGEQPPDDASGVDEASEAEVGSAAGDTGDGTAGGANAGANGAATSPEQDERPSPPSTGESGSGSPADDDDGAGTSDSPEPSGKTVRLSFVGDILLAANVQALMEKNGYDYPYAKSLTYLQGPDLTAGNLENPITKRGTPAQDKQFVFKGTPDSLPALKEAGFDVVSLANNHTLDQGVEGLLDTIGFLDETGLPNMGGGSDDQEAYEPVILEANGIKVAYIGLSRVLPVGSWKAAPDRAGVAEAYGDAKQGIEAIKAAKSKADLVVVMVHWGIEKADKPQEYQKQLGRNFIDAGADLIIGSHPHVLQGFETYKGKWIAYSLGNYIFNMTKTEKTKDTGVLDAVCASSGNCQLQFHPMRSNQSQPVPLEGEEAKALLARLSGISLGATVDSQGYVKAKE
ncbi:CapA family protein [Paenibacillus methanolicus]|uniref:Poly-gamma-glutamate synthesis protein (Capsule biosynthesis protein) n=1 Tax=Paenibacillus methanolicus TaxID=582686 RepID=A0A5S5BXW2_9BACL|nr:CapA family protein [Paenibacillus methanolicus]TYP71146.1 poly-gamma-glutamate synthesis protein (capsule biosynthesis protein) [Paenibacillus methanolicus]